MKKLLIGTALLVTALPFTFDGVTPTVSKAQAWYRGVHRGVAFHRPFVRRPVLAAAAVGAATTGLGWGGWGWGGWGGGYSGLYSYAGATPGMGGPGIGMGGYGGGMGAAGCYPTFDSSTGFNQFCVGRGFLWGTPQR
jgi:hypothetical protein